MDDQFVLRRAGIRDADALSHFCQKTYRETFAEDFGIPYSEKDLDFYFRSSASPESFVKKLKDPRRAIWVIEDKTNGELIAYTVVGPCDINDIPHPDVYSNKDGCLNRLYVRRDRQSHGFGKLLMNVMLSWFKENYPGRPIWLSVWSKNFKAQKFYSRYNFTKVGNYVFHVGEWKEDQFIMKL